MTQEMAEADLDTLEELVGRISSAKCDEAAPAFSAEESAACRAFLDVGLSACRLAIDGPSGEIVDQSMRTVVRRGVASALRTVAGCAPGKQPGKMEARSAEKSSASEKPD